MERVLKYMLAFGRILIGSFTLLSAAFSGIAAIAGFTTFIEGHVAGLLTFTVCIALTLSFGACSVWSFGYWKPVANDLRVLVSRLSEVR
jgi:hypothetical protein